MVGGKGKAYLFIAQNGRYLYRLWRYDRVSSNLRFMCILYVIPDINYLDGGMGWVGGGGGVVEVGTNYKPMFPVCSHAVFAQQ
jgi:hypothetical protein